MFLMRRPAIRHRLSLGRAGIALSGILVSASADTQSDPR
jgi:hypothetical protein